MVNLRDALDIDDLRTLAHERLPRVANEFLERGAEDEVSLRENCSAFGEIRFRPRTPEGACA